MNFKFTWLKGIVSIIIFFVAIYPLAILISILIYSGSTIARKLLIPNSIGLYSEIGMLSLIPAILIYIIWSIFQKSGRRK